MKSYKVPSLPTYLLCAYVTHKLTFTFYQV